MLSDDVGLGSCSVLWCCSHAFPTLSRRLSGLWLLRVLRVLVLEVLAGDRDDRCLRRLARLALELAAVPPSPPASPPAAAAAAASCPPAGMLQPTICQRMDEAGSEGKVLSGRPPKIFACGRPKASERTFLATRLVSNPNRAAPKPQHNPHYCDWWASDQQDKEVAYPPPVRRSAGRTVSQFAFLMMIQTPQC